MKIMRLNHVAIAVEELEPAIEFWQDVLGIKLDHIEEVPSQKARVAFFPVAGSEIELVQPTEEDSGTAKFLRSRGPGMHHLCLEVDNLTEMLEEMKGKGVRLINEQPIEMDDRRLAFIHPKSTGGVLLELYEIKK